MNSADLESAGQVSAWLKDRHLIAYVLEVSYIDLHIGARALDGSGMRWYIGKPEECSELIAEAIALLRAALEKFADRKR